jgi:hypothetical protein
MHLCLSLKDRTSQQNTKHVNNFYILCKVHYLFNSYHFIHYLQVNDKGSLVYGQIKFSMFVNVFAFTL